MPLTGEIGELNEHPWRLIQSQSRDVPDETLEPVDKEIRDLHIDLTLLADRLDLPDTLKDKIYTNESKYPVHMAHGPNRKHGDL